MELIKTGMAGTVESGDILVEIEKTEGAGVEIQLDSTVMGLYGRRIREVISETVRVVMVGIAVAVNVKGQCLAGFVEYIESPCAVENVVIRIFEAVVGNERLVEVNCGVELFVFGGDIAGSCVDMAAQ